MSAPTVQKTAPKSQSRLSAVFFALFPAVFIKRRVAGVKVFGIEPLFGAFEPLAEPLIMHDLPLPQELDRVTHFGVVDQPQDVVVGGARFLL